MKKLLFAGFLWEVLRFFYVYFFASATNNFDLFLWLNSQQIITVFALFFLWRDSRRFFQYSKLLLVAKIFSAVTGLVFIFKLFNTAGFFSPAVVLIPGSVVFMDLLMLILFIRIVKKGDESDAVL